MTLVAAYLCLTSGLREGGLFFPLFFLNIVTEVFIINEKKNQMFLAQMQYHYSYQLACVHCPSENHEICN